jgi:MFS family permease
VKLSALRRPGFEEPDAGYPPLRYGSYVIGVLLLAWVVAFLDRQILSLLVDELRAALGLNDIQISLLQGLAFTLFFSLAALPIGWLVDRHNRRNILVAGIVVWCVGTFCCGLAATFAQFFAARLAVGAGEACLAPAAASIVADYFAPSRRGRAMGVMLAGAALGIGIANLVGGALLKVLAARGEAVLLPGLGAVENWRVVFMLASLPAIPLVLLLMNVREPIRRGLSAAPTKQDSSAAERSFGAYFVSQRGLYAGLFLIFGMNSIMGYGVISWGPAIFMRAHGMAAGDVGIMLGLVLLCVNSVAAFLGGLLSDFMVGLFPADGRLRTLLVTMPCALCFLSLFAVTGHPAVTLLAFAGAGGFSASLNSVCYNVLYDVTPAAYRGQIVSTYMLVGTFLGLAIGPTAIALATEHLFHAADMVQFSVLLVGAASLMLALALIAVTLAPYRATQHMILQWGI